MMKAKRRHGLTMIELLAALALLTLIIPASLIWTTHATRIHREAMARSAWQAAAEAALQLIHDDLRSGDFDHRRRQDRVRIVDGVLQIRTRDHGAAVHRYENDRITRSLQRFEEEGDEFGRTWTLLADVGVFEVQLNREDQWLDVRITGSNEAWTASRRFAL